MNRINLLTSLIFLLLCYLSEAQEKQKFTIAEAQQYAEENNKQLENARRDIMMAEQEHKAALGQGLPQVSGTMDYMTNFNYEAELEFGSGDADPPQVDYTKFDPGDYELLKILNSFSSSGPTTIEMTDQANAQLQVSQLIFSGQYWVGLQTANIGYELARQNAKITALDVKETVTNTYQLILVTREIVDILDKNLQNLEEIKTHTNNMYAAGMAEQTDVDQISISISKLENQKKSLERNVNISYNMLKYQMGLNNDQEIILTDSLNGILDHLEAASSLAKAFEIHQNPNYQIIETQTQLQEKMVDMQKWAYAPTITGFYSYTEKIMTTGFDLSPNNAAGLTLNVPIFSSGIRKAELEKARIELDKSQRNKEMVREQLRLQNNQLRYELSSALENYNTQKQNVTVAKRVLESIQNKYKQGLVSSLDLTQANTNYLTAESDYLNAALELMQANLELKKLYNEI
ncbi:MAG: TolC family protein [Bacteroidales bacterium]